MSVSRRGFALVEALVVCAVLAVLLALVVPVLARARALGRDAACLSNLSQVAKGVASYVALHAYAMPSDWADVLDVEPAGLVCPADERRPRGPYVLVDEEVGAGGVRAWLAAGGAESGVAVVSDASGWHWGGRNLGYLDGHAAREVVR